MQICRVKPRAGVFTSVHVPDFGSFQVLFRKVTKKTTSRNRQDSTEQTWQPQRTEHVGQIITQILFPHLLFCANETAERQQKDLSRQPVYLWSTCLIANSLTFSTQSQKNPFIVMCRYSLLHDLIQSWLMRPCRAYSYLIDVGKAQMRGAVRQEDSYHWRK